MAHQQPKIIHPDLHYSGELKISETVNYIEKLEPISGEYIDLEPKTFLITNYCEPLK